MLHKKLTKAAAVLLSVVILFSSCASSTMIQSIPSGASVYIDGEPAGTTPYRYTDKKIVGSETRIELVMDGYEPYQAFISRSEEPDVGAIIGGLFFFVPFLWTMGYKPTHTYELFPMNHSTPDSRVLPGSVGTEIPAVNKTKAERLAELKDLLEQGLITEKDYENQKQRILEE